MTRQESFGAAPSGGGAPGSPGSIRDRSVREAVERTREVIRKTREMLESSRDLLERVRQRDREASPPSGVPMADEADGANAGSEARPVDGRA